MPERITAVETFRQTRGYVIWATPRCGGTLLSRILTATNIAGRPEEYFFRPLEEYYSRLWCCGTFEDYLRAALSQATTPNGVVGLKFDAGDYLSHFDARLRTLSEFCNSKEPTITILRSLLGHLKFIWLMRRNKVRQCVSWLKAAQTGEWMRDVISNGNYNIKPRYDYGAIERLVNECVMREAAYQEIFDEVEIHPLTIVYEDMIEDIEGTVRRIIQYLELEMVLPIAKAEDIGMVRQADATNEEWVQRYREELQLKWPQPSW